MTTRLNLKALATQVSERGIMTGEISGDREAAYIQGKSYLMRIGLFGIDTFTAEVFDKSSYETITEISAPTKTNIDTALEKIESMANGIKI